MQKGVAPLKIVLFFVIVVLVLPFPYYISWKPCVIPEGCPNGWGFTQPLGFILGQTIINEIQQKAKTGVVIKRTPLPTPSRKPTTRICLDSDCNVLIYPADPRNVPQRGLVFEKLSFTNGGVDVNKLEAGKNYLVNNNTEWKRLMLSPIPDLDFNKYSIIIVNMGGQSSGGYSIEIKQIIEEASQVKVLVQTTTPGPGCAVTLALTFPYEVVRVQKINKEVIFNVEKVVHVCKR